jgi:hypothetical protein
MPGLDQSEWIARLDLMHARIRAGEPTSATDLAWYLDARRALLATALDEQQLGAAPGERLRRAVRLDRAVPVTLGGARWAIDTATSDLGVGGFAAFVGPGVPHGVAWAELGLGNTRLHLKARLVRASAAPGDHQVRFSCQFEDVSTQASAAIEDFLLDELLPRIVFWDGVLQKIRT